MRSFGSVALGSAYIFGDSGVLNSHVTVGRIVVALELLVFVTALVGWWGDRYEITISTALLVVGTFQALFAKDIDRRPRYMHSTGCWRWQCSPSRGRPSSERAPKCGRLVPMTRVVGRKSLGNSRMRRRAPGGDHDGVSQRL